VHRVHDVVADAQVGQRDRHAFLDRAQLDALGRLAVDLAIAEHVQAQARESRTRFDRTRST
jgi:predicted ATPase